MALSPVPPSGAPPTRDAPLWTAPPAPPAEVPAVAPKPIPWDFEKK
ncbi:MAG TPA: hypothetical protein VFZ53_25890 [Polyangiaceae bacterium]